MLLVTAAFCSLLLVLRRHPYSLVWLEDLPVYASALHAFVTGGDPYAVNVSGLHFVYPPVVLFPAAWLARLLPLHGETVLFTVIHVASVLAMPFVLARYFVRARWWGWLLPLLVLVAEPGVVGFRALYSANIAPTLYLAAFLAAVPGIRRNFWQWFYLVVMLAAMAKITFLVLLLLPLLAGKRQWTRSMAVGGTVVAANLSERQLFPGLYAGYKAALVQQIAAQQLYGFGVFGFAARLEHHMLGTVGLFAYGLHFVFVLLMVGTLIIIKRRHDFQPGLLFSGAPTTANSIWLGLLTIAVILANPRVLHYDIYIALVAAYAIVAVVSRVDRWKLVALAVLLHLPSLLFLLGVRSYTVQTGWELSLVLAAFGLGAWRLFQPASIVEPGVDAAGTDSGMAEATVPAVSY